MAMLEIKGVSKSYGGTPVLRGIDLSVEAGELMFLLGPSGCGKSTLLRIVAGLIRQDAGSVVLDGRDVSALPPESRNTPMVFQNYALWPHLNVAENIEFGLKIKKIPRDEIRKTVDEMLAVVGMSEFAKRKVNELSGGQQQRVAIARGLASNPEIIYFDEPTSALDPELIGEVLSVMRKLAEDGMTMLVVTHEMDFARNVSNKVLFMADGGVVESGPSKAFFENPQAARSREFIRSILEARQ